MHVVSFTFDVAVPVGPLSIPFLHFRSFGLPLNCFLHANVMEMQTFLLLLLLCV